MARRVYLWAGTGIVTLVGLFAVLQTLGLLIWAEPISYCNGNICESVIRITNPTGNDTDIYNKLQVRLDFTPEIKWNEFMVEDGSCKLKADGTLSRSSTGVACGKAGWRWLNFTDETKPRKDRIYVWRFAKYSSKNYLLRGEKNSLFDVVKWGIGIGNNTLDPVWITANHTAGKNITGQSGYFLKANVLMENVSKYVANANEPILFSISNLFSGAKTFTCGVQVDDLKVQSWKKRVGTKLVLEEFYNVSLKKTIHLNGTVEFKQVKVNATNISITVPVYEDLLLRSQAYDGRNWLVTEFNLNSKGISTTEIKLRPLKYFRNANVKYSFLCNASGEYVDFEPVINDSNRLPNATNWYQFENVLNDTGKGGNNLSIAGGTGYTANNLNSGYLNKGVYFDADDESLDQLNNVFYSGQSNRTTWAWVNTSDGALSHWMSSGTSSATGTSWEGQINTQFKLEEWSQAIGTVIPVVNRWYFIAMTANSSHTCIYVNGTLDVCSTASINTGANPVRIGARLFAANQDWNGFVDEVAFFNVSLNASQILAAYETYTEGDDPLNVTPAPTPDVGAEPLRPANITFPRAGISTNYTAINFSGIGNFTLYIYRNGTFMQNVSRNTTMNLSYPEGEYLMNFSVSNGTHWYANQSINYTYDNLSPKIDFVANTPSNGAASLDSWIFVNTTSSDGTEHSTFVDFNNSLVGYWRFENGSSTRAKDDSSYGSDGTLFSFACTTLDCSTTSGWVSNGKRGKGLSFDGVNDYVNVSKSDGSTFNQLDGLQAASLEAWVKPTNGTFGVADISTILWRQGNNNVFGLGGGWTAHKAGGFFQFTVGSSTVESTSAIDDGNWHHLIATYNGSHTTFYVDGVQNANSDVGLKTIQSATNAFTSIGGRLQHPNPFDRGFDGVIDEVKVYSRALSAQEVNASFNAGIYRLERNFTGLSVGSYNYTAYAVDSAGTLNQTAMRTYLVLGVGKNWWDGRFGRRINFTLTEENGTNREYEPVEINVTGLAGSINNCVREVRIVYNGSDNRTSRQFEVPSQVLKSNEADGWCHVLFQANVTRNDTVQYFAYYNYSEPYFPDYSSQSTFRFNPANKNSCSGSDISGRRDKGIVQINWKGTNSTVEEENELCIVLNGTLLDYPFAFNGTWSDEHTIGGVVDILAVNPQQEERRFDFPFFPAIDFNVNYMISNLTLNSSIAKKFWIRSPQTASVVPNKNIQLFVTIYDKWPLVKLEFFNTTTAPSFTSGNTGTNWIWYDALVGINRSGVIANISELEPWFGVTDYVDGQGSELGLMVANGSNSNLGLNFTANAGANSKRIMGDNVTGNGTFWLGFFYNAKNVGDSPTREFYEAMQHPLRPRFGSVELVPEAVTLLTLYLDNFSSDKYYEFETTASLSVAFQVNMANFTFNSTGNLTICYDIITGEFGSNYVCGNITDTVEVNLTRLSENYFGNLTANATAMNRSDNGKFNTTIDNRTVLRLFVFNITGFSSGGNYPENITFSILVNRTEASLPGMLIGKDLFEDEFIIGGSTKTIHNITYVQASSEKIFLNVSMVGVSQLEASVGSKNLTLNFSFNLSGFIVDANVSFRIIDNLSTNAYINFTASYNATTNTTPSKSNLSAWDNFASNLTAAGINRWAYESIEEAGLIIQEYAGPTTLGSSIGKNNVTLIYSSPVGNDGAARYYETEFDIRNLSRVDIDWYQSTSCGRSTEACSTTTRVIAFDGNVQATLRDYTTYCAPCDSTASYIADENISIRKVDEDTFDVYVNDVFSQTVTLSGLNANRPWRLGFYGREDGTGGIRMELHKISFNAIMAAKSGPWNNQYDKSFSVVSKPVDLVAENVTAASLAVVDLTLESLGQVNRTFELSNNNGKNWTVVSLNSRRIFDTLGSDIVWRINCTSADLRDTCIISKVIVTVNPGQVNNITIDYGDDGVADFFFLGILNGTNSPIKVTNSSLPIWAHAKNNCAGALTCAVPIKITTGSEGIIQIENVNRTQIISNITLNHTLFEASTQIFWNATFTNGIIMLDDLKARYAGSRNFSIFAHFDGTGGFLLSNSQRMMNVITSFFNETLPKLITQFEIIPKTVNDKNLTPYGQNSTRPFLNITANAYDLPLNYSIALNQTPPSCIAIRVFNNSNFANPQPLNMTRIWNKFAIAPKNTVGAWFQVDLNNCNASSLFNFNFDYKSMSLCDRCVHTIDKDS